MKNESFRPEVRNDGGKIDSMSRVAQLYGEHNADTGGRVSRVSVCLAADERDHSQVRTAFLDTRWHTAFVCFTVCSVSPLV